MKEINKCENSVGYSIHSLDPDTNYKIMGRRDIPDWDTIIPKTKNCRVQIVVNRHNIDQIDDLLKFIARYDNVKYIQVRRISTDTRYELLQEDIALYERFFDEIRKKYQQTGSFYKAQQFEIYGKQANFWRTVETSVNSINYFTDGTSSDNYFVVEGYLKNYKNR
jgi:sulfatase maturation enzyme AslB (radical SAM superfamily)